MATYWANCGKFQAENDTLFKKYEKEDPQRSAVLMHVQVLLMMNRFCYDRFNNGDHMRISRNQSSSMFEKVKQAFFLPAIAPEQLQNFVKKVKQYCNGSGDSSDEDEIEDEDDDRVVGRGERSAEFCADYVSDATLDMVMDTAVMWASSLDMNTTDRQTDAWLRLGLPTDDFLVNILQLLTLCAARGHTSAVKAVVRHFGHKLVWLQAKNSGMQDLMDAAKVSTPEIKALIEGLKLQPDSAATKSHVYISHIQCVEKLVEHCIPDVLQELITAVPEAFQHSLVLKSINAAFRFPAGHRDALETVRLSLTMPNCGFEGHVEKVLEALLRLQDTDGSITKAVITQALASRPEWAGKSSDAMLDRKTFERIKTNVSSVVNETAIQAMFTPARVAEFNAAKAMYASEGAAIQAAEAALIEAQAAAKEAQAKASAATEVARKALEEATGLANTLHDLKRRRLH